MFRLARYALSLVLLVAAPAVAVAAEPGQVCVRNTSEHTHLFAVETPDAPRVVNTLAPGEMLCAEIAAKSPTGTVSVFEHPEELEGCSRLVPAGRIEDLIKYVDFDRCFWSSNT